MCLRPTPGEINELCLRTTPGEISEMCLRETPDCRLNVEAEMTDDLFLEIDQ